MDWSSIGRTFWSQLLRGIVIITFEFWHQLPSAFLLRLLLNQVKTLVWTMSLGCLMSHGAMFLILNLWTQWLRADVIHSYVTVGESWVVLWTPREPCSSCIVLLILILDHVYQEWSKSNIDMHCFQGDSSGLLPGQHNVSPFSGTRHWILS